MLTSTHRTPHATIAARSNSLPGVLLAVKPARVWRPCRSRCKAGERPRGRIGPYPGAYVSIYLLMHQDMRHTPRVRAFFDFVATEIKAVRMVMLGEDVVGGADVESPH